MAGRGGTNQTQPTPAEAARLREVEAARQAQNATQQQVAAESADELFARANRHLAVNPNAPAEDPAVQAFTSGPVVEASSEIEVFVTGNAPRSSAPLPSVASGSTPSASTPTTPANVAQQAAGATAQTAQSTQPQVAAQPSASPNSITQQDLGPLRLTFEPNVHNEYDRVSYVFKLCMINDLDAEDPDLLNKFLNNRIRKIVIAESGVTTGFAIGDVEIIDAISANFRSRSGLTTDIRFQIIEPYGMTLPDKMFQASQELGLRNWRLAPFLLQLEFKYIKSDGSLYTPAGAQKLIKVYQLLITEFDAQLTEKGTQYDIQAAVKNNLGFRNAYTILPQTHQIQVSPGSPDPSFGVSTEDNRVGTFFTNLGIAISTMYVEIRKARPNNNRLPIIIYKFIVEPELAREELNFVPTSNSRRRSFTVPNSQTGTIMVSRGASVSALVDDILASLKNPQFFIRGPEEGNLVRIPVLECVTRNIGWDLFTNDYVRELTYIIRMKDSNRPVPTPEYGQYVQSDPQAQESRMRQVSKNLKKRYDYYYTGLNTEIISCDVKFNQMHIIPQPLFDVTPVMAFASAEQVSSNDPNITSIPAGEVSGAATQSVQQLQSISQQLNALGSDRGVSEEDLGRQVAELEAQRQRVEQRLSQIASQSIVPFDNARDLPRVLEQVTNTGTQAAELRGIAQNIAARNAARAASREFVEDINLNINNNNILELSYYADPRDIINSFTRPPTIEGGGGNNESGGTRPIVGSILSQIYDRSGQHLLEVDLEIRGDPYWLGVTDLERTQELLGFLDVLREGGTLPDRLGVPTGGTAGTTRFSREGLVDKHDQDANILLRFRAGTPPREDTGFQNLNEGSTFFYGVYTVIECAHIFKSGIFTQKLKAYRDVLINVEQLRRAEQSSGNPTQPRQVTSVSPGTQTNSRTNVGATPATPSAPAVASRSGTNNTSELTPIASSTPSSQAGNLSAEGLLSDPATLNR